MMTIDRYVLWQFLKVLLICFCSLTGLFIIIDAFTNLDELLALGEQQGNLLLVLVEYYGARALAFFDSTSALITLIAATFTVTAMQRSNEMAALMAAGIPKIRIVRPLLLISVAVALLAVGNRELLIPKYRDKLTRKAKDWVNTEAQELTPCYDNRTDVYFGGGQADLDKREIIAPKFRLPEGMGQFQKQLVAEKARYQESRQDRPRGYLLENVSQPDDLEEIPSYYADEDPIILSPSDTAWLEPKQCFLVSDVSFEHLTVGKSWQRFSSTRELIAGLHNPSLHFSADVRVRVHARFIQPLLDMCLLLLALPIVLAKESRNVFLAAGLCLLVVAGYFLVVMACHALGNSYLLRPVVAAWCPLLIFAPLASMSSAAFRR